MKKSFIYIFFFLWSFNAISQIAEAEEEFKKNIFEVDYLYLEGTNRNSEKFRGSGFEISYSRDIWKDKLYATVSWGRVYTQSDDEMLFWIDRDDNPMRILTAGVGYNIFKSEKILISGEVSYLSLRHKNIDYMESDGNGNVGTIYYGVHNDQTLRVQFKGKYLLGSNLALTPLLGYGFRNQKYETFWLKLGVAYMF